MSFFGADQEWVGLCHTYPTMMKLGTVIPYLKKIQKLYELRDTPMECIFIIFYIKFYQVSGFIKNFIKTFYKSFRKTSMILSEKLKLE